MTSTELDAAIVQMVHRRGPQQIPHIAEQLTTPRGTINDRVSRLIAVGRLSMTRDHAGSRAGVTIGPPVAPQLLARPAAPAPAPGARTVVIAGVAYEMVWDGHGPLPGSTVGQSHGSSLSGAYAVRTDR